MDKIPEITAADKLLVLDQFQGRWFFLSFLNHIIISETDIIIDLNELRVILKRENFVRCRIEYWDARDSNLLQYFTEFNKRNENIGEVIV